ncbi:MAG: hypothetical protein M3442_18875, partial [Chloroflexota bacterium]|nr:hypothetical protein [Chloroflexota bacterium]
MKPQTLAQTVALALPPAVLWTVAIWGRTSVAGLSGRWVATLVFLTFAVATWADLGTRLTARRRSSPNASPEDDIQHGGLGLLPAALLSAAVVGALYLSDVVHHRFVFEPLLKGVFLPLSLLLVLAAPGLAVAARTGWRVSHEHRLAAVVSAFQEALGARAPLLVGLTLGAVGALQAVSLINVATDDLIRYWSIADAFLSGAGYPVTEGNPRGDAFYLVDQPLYPLLILPSFALLGHRYLALHLPLILANVALPFVFYGLAGAAGAGTEAWGAGVRGGGTSNGSSRTAATPRGDGRAMGLWLALAVLCFPFYQVYALGAADPEPLWAVEAGLLLLLALRLTGTCQPPRRRLLEWVGLGIAGAAAGLTRPEGTLYAGATMLGLAWWYRGVLWRGLHDLRSRRLPPSTSDFLGYIVAGTLCAVPVGAFTLFLWREFGVVSPAGWLRIAGWRYLLPNLDIVLQRDLPAYASFVGIPFPSITGPLLATALLAAVLTGLWRFWHHRPALRFVPVAITLNIAVILLTPTDFAGDVLSPQTFLRHLSVVFPWLVPALALTLRPLLG